MSDITQQQRVDLLRERREIREMIVDDQKDIQYLMSELNGVTNRNLPTTDMAAYAGEYMEVCKDISEIYYVLEEAHKSITMQQKRLEEVDEQLLNE